MSTYLHTQLNPKISKFKKSLKFVSTQILICFMFIAKIISCTKNVQKLFSWIFSRKNLCSIHCLQLEQKLFLHKNVLQKFTRRKKWITVILIYIGPDRFVVRDVLLSTTVLKRISKITIHVHMYVCHSV